jgi:hypothetical protein
MMNANLKVLHWTKSQSGKGAGPVESSQLHWFFCLTREGQRHLRFGVGGRLVMRLFTLLTVLLGPADFVHSEEPRVAHLFQSQRLTDTYYAEGIAVGDINGDGVADVVYGPHWYAGPDFKTAQEIAPAMPQDRERYADRFFAWIFDFDRDGANDVLVVGFPGTPAYVYQNPGKGVGNWAKHQVLDWVSNESPQFVDLVGDATPELVCTRDGFFGFATIPTEQPLSTWAFHPISEQIADKRFGHGLGVGDVDGDGRRDVVHAGGWFQQPSSDPMAGRWLPHRVPFTTAYGGADMLVYDVDGDGDADIITSDAAHDFGLDWYEQVDIDGQREFKRHPIMGSRPSDNRYGVVFSELHSVALADIDGDGLQDIVTGKTYYSHHRQSPMWNAGAVVTWFRLTRGDTGVDWIPYTLDGEAGIGRQLVVSDINHDGWLDIAVGGMVGATVLLQRREQVGEATWQKMQPKVYAGLESDTVENAQQLRGEKAAAIPAENRPRIEGESLAVQPTAGSISQQKMQDFIADQWSGDAQLFWAGGQPGGTLTIPLEGKAGDDTLEIVMTCAPDYAVVQLSLDELALGPPIDLYDPQVVTTGVLKFSGLNLAGKHSLKITIAGANPAAIRAYMVGIDWLRLDASSPTDEE